MVLIFLLNFEFRFDVIVRSGRGRRHRFLVDPEMQLGRRIGRDECVRIQVSPEGGGGRLIGGRRAAVVGQGGLEVKDGFGQEVVGLDERRGARDIGDGLRSGLEGFQRCCKARFERVEPPLLHDRFSH